MNLIYNDDKISLNFEIDSNVTIIAGDSAQEKLICLIV